MKNSQPHQRKSLFSSSSTPLLFFTSLLLILVVLFGITKSLDFDIFLSPLLHRNNFFLVRSSSPPPPSSSASLSLPPSGNASESIVPPSSDQHRTDAQIGNSKQNDVYSSAAQGVQLGVKKNDGSVADDRDAGEVQIPVGDNSAAPSASSVKRVPIPNSDLGVTEAKGFDNATVSESNSKVESVHFGANTKCNLYMGKWVRDEQGYPLYKPGSCPHVDEAFDCQSNGRPDSNYLKWRWKPDACDLPRFNPADFLSRLRGKRFMLVGDSMNRNQFESLLCVLREGLADKGKMFETHGYRITKGRGFYIFKFVDYNCTVEFVRSHFLVREGIRKNAQGNSNPTLSIDRIDKTAPKWKRADILVFNTGHWWTHGKTARGKNYFKEGNQIYPRFDASEAYRRALTTWGKWIDSNLKPKKHLVFYRAYSTAHFRGGDWDSGGSCKGETEPVSKGAILDDYPLKMKIMEEVIQNMKFPVVLLNVTKLTNFRKDGHPSIYGKNITDGAKVSRRKQDCSHWCLPGVPDAWNELIYATLVYQQIPPTQ